MANNVVKDNLNWFIQIIKDNISSKIETQNFLSSRTGGLNVMSFNIRRDSVKDGDNNWQFRKKSIVEMILAESPDIICFQEVMPHMAKYLVKNLSSYYGNSGVECFTGGELSKSWFIFGEGLLILFKKSRFSFVDKEVIKLFDGRTINVRRALTVNLFDKITNTNYTVVNTHFCHQSDEARYNSFDLLEDLFCSLKHPLFICGDFNCQIGDTDSGIDIFCRYFHHNEIDELGTFNRFNTPSGKTIDFIFSNHKPIRTEILRNGGNIKFLSDHYPVITIYDL